MKKFLVRPRSIIGSTLWGVVVAITTFVLILLADFILSAVRGSFGYAKKIESIAVGGGYSISLKATPAHPFLAEYKQSISVFGGHPRVGELLGEVDIPMNTGGRIRIGVLVPKEFKSPQVVLADRSSTTSISLENLKSTKIESWENTSLQPIGIISGESYPPKFIPCSVWPFLSKEEQEHIVSLRDPLYGFCE